MPAPWTPKSSLFFQCKLIGSLEEVHMPQNGINYAGVMALASAMRHNPELRVLNFNDNTFTKKGTLAMAQVRPCLHIPYKTAHILPVCFCFLYTVFSCRPRRLWDTWGMCRWSTLATAWCAAKEPSPSRQSSERDCQSSRSVGHQISAFLRVSSPSTAWLRCSVVFLVFRSSICHLVRSQRQQH